MGVSLFLWPVGAHPPRALLLDEPSNDLDPGHRNKLLHILQGLAIGWIIISHDFDFLRQSCTSS